VIRALRRRNIQSRGHWRDEPERDCRVFEEL
jgi:hypothetical protein